MGAKSSGLHVGEPAPDFSLPALNGARVGLWECLLEGPVVVEFLRGTWCPEARRRLVELAKARDRIRERCGRLLAVVCEDPFTVERYFAKQPTQLTVLLDTDRTMARAYRVFKRFGIERWNIARPATFVIDRAGYIRLAFVAPTRLDACPVGDVLACLDER